MKNRLLKKEIKLNTKIDTITDHLTPQQWKTNRGDKEFIINYCERNYGYLKNIGEINTQENKKSKAQNMGKSTKSKENSISQCY